jgi:hypothetical protein
MPGSSTVHSPNRYGDSPRVERGFSKGEMDRETDNVQIWKTSPNRKLMRGVSLRKGMTPMTDGTEKTSSIFQFGETVPGYRIPVLNEREIRAAAGLLFLMMFTTILTIGITQSFTPLKYAIVAFLIDIAIRVFINPRYSPTLIVGRWIVRNQVPEYVGAKQKKFAWIIGLVLALTMFTLMVVANTYSPITGIICLICLIFLFFETAFGICLGCRFYSLVYREKAQYCPGEVCEVKDRHPIQRTGFGQLAIVLLFVASLLGTGFFFHDVLNRKPSALLGPDKQEEASSIPE